MHAISKRLETLCVQGRYTNQIDYLYLLLSCTEFTCLTAGGTPKVILPTFVLISVNS